jgi:hypothetical protein
MAMEELAPHSIEHSTVRPMAAIAKIRPGLALGPDQNLEFPPLGNDYMSKTGCAM